MAGQQAIAVGGATRSGKSVVAAALTKQGCDLVADDFTIVDSSSEPPVVLPDYQKLRLWKDACIQLDLLGTAVAKAHPYFEKYVLPSPGVFSGAPPSLSDIFILSEERSSEFSAERLRPIDGMQGLLAMLHTPDEARALGRMPQVFSAMNAIVSQVRMWRIAAPDGLDQVERTARSILSLVEA